MDEFLQLFSEDFWVFLGVHLDTFEVEDVGLVFLGVFVNFALGVGGEDRVAVDTIGNVVENDLVLIFVFSQISLVLHSFESLIGQVFGLPDVADVEEDAGVAEGLLVGLGLGDGDFVDFDAASEEGFDYSLNLLLEILVVEVLGFAFLEFFFCEAVSFELEHHLGQIFRDDSPGNSNLLLQNGSPVESLLHEQRVVLRPVVDEGESLRLLEFCHRMLQPVDWLYAEVLLDHCSGHTLLKPAHENSARKLLLLFLLLIGVAWSSSHGALEGGSADRHTAEGRSVGQHSSSHGRHTPHGEGRRNWVQLFHGFYLLKLIMIH